MTKYKSQGLRSTFRNARKGVRLALKSEMNIRIHIVIAFFVILAAILLGLCSVEICVLLLTIAAVISAEMFNTAIEFSLDALFHNKYSRLVGMAKDISAGAVMFVTVISIFVGCFIFIPAIYSILK